MEMEEDHRDREANWRTSRELPTIAVVGVAFGRFR
jgi:hypothetical protein